MNDATLQGFRDLAAAMAGPEPRDWEWHGMHMSQHMFRITRQQAEAYAERYGGTAGQMESASATECSDCGEVLAADGYCDTCSRSDDSSENSR